ncbi:MAG: PucR family transcriptional regulator [Sedimentibacter sp.]
MFAKDYKEKEQLFKEKCLKIYESLISGKGVQHIIQTASDILGNPISLSDSSYRHLAYSKNIEVNDPIWNDITFSGYSSFEIVKIFIKEKLIERINDSELPIIVDTGIGSNMKRILGKVTISEKPVAYIGVFEVTHKLGDEDIKLTQVLCSTLSVELSKNPSVSNFTGSLCENLIIDIISGTNLDETFIKDRMNSSLWIPEKNFNVVYIQNQKFLKGNTKIKNFRIYLEKLSPYYKSVVLNNSIILLMNYKDEEAPNSLWDELAYLLNIHSLKAGISFKFSNLIELKSYYKQAEFAYSIGIKTDTESQIYYFKEYYHLHLLSKVSKDVHLYDYCHESILKLQEFDKTNSTDYSLTLYEYLNNSCSLVNTSKKLFIHKNTLLHRLNRIKEISGLGLIEEEDKFKIYLSYKILEYMHVSNIVNEFYQQQS